MLSKLASASSAPLAEHKCPYCPKTFETPRGSLVHLGQSPKCIAARRAASSAVVQSAKAPRAAPPDAKAAAFRSEQRSHVSAALASLRGDDDNLGDASMGRIKQKVTSILGRAEAELVRRLQHFSTSTSDPELKRIVHETLDVFNGLESAEREFAYLTEHVQYIEPVEHVFDTSVARTVDAEGFTYSEKMVKHRGYYIPMSATLERLLQLDPHALEMVLASQRAWFAAPPPKGTTQKVYIDIPDGILFEEHPELGRSQRGKAQGGRLKLCLVLYYDGIEVRIARRGGGGAAARGGRAGGRASAGAAAANTLPPSLRAQSEKLRALPAALR